MKQPIVEAKWLASLEHFRLRDPLDDRVEAVGWSALPPHLTFRSAFNRPVEIVAWLTWLHQCAFTQNVNDSIGKSHMATFPVSSRLRFNQLIDKAK